MYISKLGLVETEIAIKFVKDNFEAELARALDLTRVSAPLFVQRQSGLNDDLNGVERSVAFDVGETGEMAEVVHSLAKWKRYALAKYGFALHKGIYTDMNAIRRDEECDALHSLYVDQWDWEKVIAPEDRNEEYLQEVVRTIYGVILRVSRMVTDRYPQLGGSGLPANIAFMTSQDMEDRWPDLEPRERENTAAREFGAIFIQGIGAPLASGKPHDGRAPDYDDWALNGDIVVYNAVLDKAFELSSMGIRVDAESLRRQLEHAGKLDRLNYTYHQQLMAGELPLTVGGGIGQSRLCMLMLEKAHIGEVQSSLWPEALIEQCKTENIFLL